MQFTQKGAQEVEALLFRKLGKAEALLLEKRLGEDHYKAINSIDIMGDRLLPNGILTEITSNSIDTPKHLVHIDTQLPVVEDNMDIVGLARILDQEDSNPQTQLRVYPSKQVPPTLVVVGGIDDPDLFKDEHPLTKLQNHVMRVENIQPKLEKVIQLNSGRIQRVIPSIEDMQRQAIKKCLRKNTVTDYPQK
ncbi:MAG: hypothetical protein HEQ32_07075 [Vampirovibrio sp.]